MKRKRNEDGRRRTRSGRVRAAAVTVTGTAAAAAMVGLALPAAAAPARVWGTEHFQIMSTTTRPASTANPLIAYGLFTAAGADWQNSSRIDTFYFHGGYFKVWHAPIKNTEHQYFNPRTCFFSYSERGTFRVGYGVGKYWGIEGGGTYALSVIGIGGKLRNGACNPSQTAPAAAQQQEIQATGLLSLR
jgi:hypothetical protein